LGDDQDFAATVGQGSIHLALPVVKNAQISNFLSEPFCARFGIVSTYAEQDTEARTDSTDHGARDQGSGLAHPLNYGAHEESPVGRWGMLRPNH
jgi:hypothetical protein